MLPGSPFSKRMETTARVQKKSPRGIDGQIFVPDLGTHLSMGTPMATPALFIRIWMGCPDSTAQRTTSFT